MKLKKELLSPRARAIRLSLKSPSLLRAGLAIILMVAFFNQISGRVLQDSIETEDVLPIEEPEVVVDLTSKSSADYLESSPLLQSSIINLTAPLGGSDLTGFSMVNLSSAIDLDSYLTDYAKKIGETITLQPRNDAHIKTDKVVYKPGDIMYIEVYLVDSFTKAPLISYTQPFPDNQRFPVYYSNYFYGTLTVLDSQDKQVYSTSTSATNSTLSFTFVIPESQAGGLYKLIISGSNMADTYRMIRIREFQTQDLVVQGQFDKESFRPGDLASGTLTVATQDGSPFSVQPTYSFVALLGNDSTVQQANLKTDLQGHSSFSFEIPSTTNLSSVTVAFTVRYLSVVVPFSLQLNIAQPNTIVVDFFPETYNYVLDVPNKVYYQFYTGADRKTTLDITSDGADNQLSLLSVNPESENAAQVTLSSNLDTLSLGRGYFEFTPKKGLQYFLQNSHSQGYDRFDLNISNQVELEEWEIQFSVTKKVIENDEDLEIRIFTNGKMDPNDVYIVGVYNKERPFFLEQMSFEANKSYLLTVDQNDFYQFNGGVLRVQLFRILRPLIWYERFEALSQGKQPYYFTASESDIEKERAAALNALRESPKSFILGNRTSPNLGYVLKSKRTQLPDPYFYYFTIPKGELLFFKKPSGRLNVSVTTDKQTYQPGDMVNFEITVDPVNETQGVWVSALASDESVKRQLSPRDQPPSLPAMILLEKEIYKIDYEWTNNDQYVDQWYSQGSTGSDLKLDLLLGVQGWRLGFFYPQVIEEWPTAVKNMSDPDKYLLQQVFSYKFENQYINYYSGAFNRVSDERASAFDSSSGGAEAFAPSPTAAATAAEAPVTTPSTTTETGGVESGPSAQEQSKQLTLAQREQALWNLIKRVKQCDFFQNTRFYRNEQNYGFLFSGERFDLTDTLYYTTANFSADGTHKGSFAMSDVVSQFRISANAFDFYGRLGYGSALVANRKVFYISYQLPSMLVQGDRIQVPVRTYYFPIAAEQQNKSLNARIRIGDSSFELGVTLGNENEVFTISPNSSVADTLTLEGLNITGGNKVYVQLRAESSDKEFVDGLTRQTQIVSPGVLQLQQQGGFITEKESEASFDFQIPSTAVPKTFNFTAELYPQSFQEIISAIIKIILQPLVCDYCLSGNLFLKSLAFGFDSSIPNLQSQLTHDYLSLAGKQNPDGSFGVSSGTSDPIGTGSTLLSLASTRNAQNKSSVTLSPSFAIERGIKYLLSLRDDSGSFTKASIQGKDQYLVDAYLVWILTEIGYNGSELNLTLTNLQQIANQQTQGSTSNSNAFFLGMLSSIYSNLNRTNEALALADYLQQIQDPSDGSVRSETNFFSSYSYDYLEATAMAAIAWEKADFDKYLSNIQLAVRYLVRNTYVGTYFYPTQSSILSLYAILNYISRIDLTLAQGDGEISLLIDGDVVVSRQKFSTKANSKYDYNGGGYYYDYYNTQDNTVIFDTSKIEERLAPGGANVVTMRVDSFTPANVTNSVGETELSGSNYTLQYRMVVTYDDTRPVSVEANRTDLSFSVDKLSSGEGIGDLASYNVTLSNKNDNRSLGLIIVVFRGPACFTLNFGAFEQLKANGIISLYEFKNGNSEAWLYIDGLEPSETLSFQIDLLRTYLGNCQERPQEAFEYFNPQARLYQLL